MKILAIDTLKEGVTRDHLEPYLDKELNHAWDIYKSGKFREMYNRGDVPGVAFFMECDTLQEAHQIINQLPMVQAKLIEFKLIPLEPFTHWSRLFTN